MQPYFNGSLAGASGIDLLKAHYSLFGIAISKSQYSYNRKQAIGIAIIKAQHSYKAKVAQVKPI